MKKVEECFSLIKDYYSNLNDSIAANMYHSAALYVAKEIARKAYPNCGDERAYSICFIICAAVEMGKSLSELEHILKEFGTL